MAGSDDVENVQIAAAVDAIHGILIELVQFFVEKDDKRKVQAVSLVMQCVFLIHAVSLVF